MSDAKPDRSYHPSIQERIAWTTSFTRGNDKVVLQAIARWADFESGRNAFPGMERLLESCRPLSQRSIERSLQRLVDEGWVVARRAHLKHTRYDIVMAKLATRPAEVTLVDRASPTVRHSGGQDPSTVRHSGGQKPRSLSATVAGLSANMADAVRHSGGRTCDQVPVISTQKHRRAKNGAPARTGKGQKTQKPKPGGARGLVTRSRAPVAARAADVRADGGAGAGRDRDAPGRDGRRPPGVEQAAPPGGGVSVRVGRDLPGAGRADGSGANVGPPSPIQQAFGPLDVTATPTAAQREAARRQLAVVIREALAKAGAPVPKRRHAR